MDIDDAPPEPPADPARRNKRVTLAVAAGAIALALVGSFYLRQQHPTNGAAPRPAVTQAAPAPVPWLSAMVARDGRSVTVYAGTSLLCAELVQPQATVAGQDGTQVTVAVRARVLAAVDCTTTGSAVPLVLSLPEPLGNRVLRDAASPEPPPTYLDRDLPDLGPDQRWSPNPGQWSSTDTGWYQGYNGPGGLHLVAAAGRTAQVVRPAGGRAVTVGGRHGVVTGAPESSWTLWWTAGEVTYSLRLTPAEGTTVTRKQFEREIGRLAWR